MMFLFLLIIYSFPPTAYSSQSEFPVPESKGYFLISPSVKEIYKKMLHLQIVEATEAIQKQKKSEPNNKMYDFLESYAWFFTLFILEEESLYKRAIPHKTRILEEIQKGDPQSPYYLFCQAEILLQWATIHLKFNDKTRAAYDVYEAYKLLEENKKRFPAFIENNKSLSIIHALAQSLPTWVQKLSGIKGSIEKGTKEIESLVINMESLPLFKEEILAIYVYILFYSKHKKEKAYQVIKKYKMHQLESPLLVFLSSTITQKSGRNDEAIQILESRKKLKGQLPFYYLDFLYGKYKLYRLDPDADKYIKQFVTHFKGRHYIKEAYQKLYWYEILFRKNIANQKLYKQAIKSSGKALIDEDVQALSELKNTQPDPILLKARLLFDGGYYSKSQNLLINTPKNVLDNLDLEEYNYRVAKNADALSQIQLAIVYYKNTIAINKGKKYFACSAAYSLGLIYENEKNYSKARFYLNQCLTLHPEGYANSLHQKAKTALSRIENKG